MNPASKTRASGAAEPSVATGAESVETVADRNISLDRVLADKLTNPL